MDQGKVITEFQAGDQILDSQSQAAQKDNYLKKLTSKRLLNISFILENLKKQPTEQWIFISLALWTLNRMLAII